MDFLKNLKTNIFWNASHERTAQKFYLTLCLYISAVSDLAVGLDLKDQKKLNWSTTASYYSIVHSARMIIFAAVGDYPTQHNKISDLFTGNPSSGRRNGSSSYEFSTDWLSKFTKDNAIRSNFKLEDMYSYYEQELKLTNSLKCMQAFGKTLKNAQKLRNDSNYEALLIAHEYEHETVTKYFEDLSKAMSEGAELCLRIATKCFINYVENDPSLENESRDKFKYFIAKYIEKRIYKFLENRGVNIIALEKIRNCTEPLETLNDEIKVTKERDEDVEIKFRELENLVSRRLFDRKAKLMNNFNTKIRDLETNLKEANEIFRSV